MPEIPQVVCLPQLVSLAAWNLSRGGNQFTKPFLGGVHQPFPISWRLVVIQLAYLLENIRKVAASNRSSSYA